LRTNNPAGQVWRKVWEARELKGRFGVMWTTAVC